MPLLRLVSLQQQQQQQHWTWTWRLKNRLEYYSIGCNRGIYALLLTQCQRGMLADTRLPPAQPNLTRLHTQQPPCTNRELPLSPIYDQMYFFKRPKAPKQLRQLSLSCTVCQVPHKQSTSIQDL
eukprot:GHUV01055159.1.p1 GENE.GHUV01055159.1~~GHUV01055159.1.p1  ORF type:complete len:124 (-),score=17.55 GHUV01055159.1:123-494(-)